MHIPVQTGNQLGEVGNRLVDMGLNIDQTTEKTTDRNWLTFAIGCLQIGKFGWGFKPYTHYVIQNHANCIFDRSPIDKIN